jgi:hypothetical protein
MVGRRSRVPKEELRLERLSKWPDRFSRRVACNARPESLHDVGVVGIDGNFSDDGDIECGGLSLIVDDVDGRF